MNAVTGAVTTRFAGGGKRFSWSFSKLKNFEVCPKRHKAIDIDKTHKDKGGPQLEWGNQVHAAMTARLVSKTPLPIEMIDYEFFAKRVEQKIAAGGTLLVEQKFAITREFGPTGYFAPDVWYRGIGDVVVLHDNVALTIDWKTGGIKDESVQLALMAQCIFSFYPAVQKVASRFAWLKEHAETDEIFTRADMIKLWPGILARVHIMENAAQTQDYPPTPQKGNMCKEWCPVVSCPFHGIGA